MTKRIPLGRSKKEQAALDKKSRDLGFIYCAMCHSPIQRDLTVWEKVQGEYHVYRERAIESGVERYSHLNPLQLSGVHDAMPEPAELKGKISIIAMLSESSNLLQDWKNRLAQGICSWVGPSQVTRIEGGYKMEICVPMSQWQAALDDGLKHGIYAGKLPAAAKPKTVKVTKDDEIEEVEDEKTGEKKRVIKKKEVTKTGRATATAGGSDIKTWWQCPTCKRRIKSGADFHYGKSPQCLKKG